MIQTIVADDHRAFRRAICLLLEADGIEVVSEAQTGSQAIELTRQHPPDVLVTDISLPELNGIEVIDAVLALDEKTQVVMISLYVNARLIAIALNKGAQGFVAKASIIEHLVPAVRSAHEGQRYLCPLTRQALQERANGAH